MASHTIATAPWAPATVVSVYLESSMPGTAATPSGSVVTTGTVTASQSVTFTGVSEGIRYLAYAGGVTSRFLVPFSDGDSLEPVRTRVEDLEARSTALESSTVLKIPKGIAAPGAEVQAAIEEIVAGGIGGDIWLEGGVHSLETAIALPCNLTKRLRIRGMPGATLRLNNTSQVFNINRRADHDILRYVSIEDLWFDGDGVNVDGNTHVILGHWLAGAQQLRIGYQGISLRRLRAYNLPYTNPSTSNERMLICLRTAHPDNDEATQDTIEDILVEDCYLDGGSNGVTIGGFSGGNNAIGTERSANVFLDRVFVNRVRHKINTTPSADAAFYFGAHVHVGHHATGGIVRISNCDGEGSRDVGVEVNGVQDSIVERCRMKDCGIPFYYVNYHVPTDPTSQSHTWRKCTAGWENWPDVDGTGGAGTNPVRAFYIGPSSGLSGDVGAGHVSLEKSKVVRLGKQRFSIKGEAFFLDGQKIQSLTIDGLEVIYPNVALNPTASTTGLIAAAHVHVGSISGQLTRVKIKDFAFTIKGSKSGAFGQEIRPLSIGGQNVLLDIDGYKLNSQITTPTNGGHILLTLGQQAGSSMRGSIRNLQLGALANDTSPIIVRMESNLTISSSLRFRDFDMLAATGGTPTYFSFGDATNQQPKTFARDFQRKVAQVSSAITVTASPFSYRNLSFDDARVTVQGGTVSKIELSRDNSSFVDTGVTQGSFVVPHADYLRVTYSVAPTMTLVPSP